MIKKKFKKPKTIRISGIDYFEEWEGFEEFISEFGLERSDYGESTLKLKVVEAELVD